MTIVHCAALEIAVDAETAYTFMADGLAQNRWALGSRERERIADDLFVGTSSFEGTRAFVRLEADPARLLVDYHCGIDRNDLRRVVEARVTPERSWAGPQAPASSRSPFGATPRRPTSAGT